MKLLMFSTSLPSADLLTFIIKNFKQVNAQALSFFVQSLSSYPVILSKKFTFCNPFADQQDTSLKMLCC